MPTADRQSIKDLAAVGVIAVEVAVRVGLFNFFMTGLVNFELRYDCISIFLKRNRDENLAGSQLQSGKPPPPPGKQAE